MSLGVSRDQNRLWISKIESYGCETDKTVFRVGKGIQHTYIHTYIHTKFIQDANKLIYRKKIILKDILESGQRLLSEMAAKFKALC